MLFLDTLSVCVGCSFIFFFYKSRENLACLNSARQEMKHVFQPCMIWHILIYHRIHTKSCVTVHAYFDEINTFSGNVSLSYYCVVNVDIKFVCRVGVG